MLNVYVFIYICLNKQYKRQKKVKYFIRIIICDKRVSFICTHLHHFGRMFFLHPIGMIDFRVYYRFLRMFAKLGNSIFVICYIIVYIFIYSVCLSILIHLVVFLLLLFTHPYLSVWNHCYFV